MIERYSRPAMKRVWSDDNKFQKWLQVEVAVCQAWAELGAIPRNALASIQRAFFDPAHYQEHLQVTHHDMTAFLNTVGETVGEAARFIHLGLTSSDVMDTALALQLQEAAKILDEDLAQLQDALAYRAKEHKSTIMMGRTHGVHAEPITFGLKMALWLEEVKRGRERLEAARKSVNVGKISGAVGTYATVPPEVERKACATLGLEPDPISSQIVQRDRHAHFVTALALIAASLEKFATEIRALQRTEIREAEEPFEEGQTGSSAMPHKKNPELSERVCGLARLLRGHALTAMENVALWHERDISHSSAERLILPDSCLALDYIISLFTHIMVGLNVYPERMKANVELTKGLVFSQRVLLALIEKGMSRREAYALVQRAALRAWRDETDFYSLLCAEPEIAQRLPPHELKGLFDYRFFLRHVDEVIQRLEI